MKKKIILSLLVVSFLNYIGCYSYTSITEEDIKKGHPLVNESIKLVLEDETEIESYPYTHFKIEESTDIVMGKGDVLNKQTGVQKKFEGKIDRNVIDSSKTFNTDLGKQSVYWLKNDTKILFHENNSLDITPDLGMGYYLGNGINSGRLIESKEIKDVQIKKLDGVATAVTVVIGLAASIGLGILISKAITPKIDLSGLSNIFNTRYNGGYY